MSWQGKTAVVTGGTGFIGSFLVEYLLQAGAHVRVPSRLDTPGVLAHRADAIEWKRGDITDSHFCRDVLQGADQLFHLASYRKNVAVHRAECSAVIQHNVRMTLALTEALAHRPVPSVFFSTALAPSVVDLPALAAAPFMDGYGVGKALCEVQWLALSRQYDVPVLIPRPVGVYGPRDRFADDANVIPALILRAEQAQVELTVWGDGSAVRQFLYVEDVIAALCRLLDAGATGLQMIVPDEQVSMADLALHIVHTVRPGLRLQFDATKPSASLVFPSSVRHAVLESLPWTPLSRGLQQTYAWYTEHRAQ